MSDESERDQQEHDATDVEEMRSQVAWLEAHGWSIGEDGLWRHPEKAADVGLTHSQAFTVEARTGDPEGCKSWTPDQPPARPARAGRPAARFTMCSA